MQGMQDSSLRKVRRPTTLLLKVTRYEREMEIFGTG
jgi:hypothetical protein